VLFYNEAWEFLNDKSGLHEQITSITGIGRGYLSGHVGAASIAKRMSWAASRTTRRLEDIAYCLMGSFSVNMPLLYGEQAFIRLQKAIMKSSDDESLFAWSDESANPRSRHGLLADLPLVFNSVRKAVPHRSLESQPPLSISLGVLNPGSEPRDVVLHCRPPGSSGGFTGPERIQPVGQDTLQRNGLHYECNAPARAHVFSPKCRSPPGDLFYGIPNPCTA
jgi:hypothetical protein